MNGRHRKPAPWATFVGSIALVGVGTLAVAGLANAQPVPQDPTVPVIPPPVPAVPGEAPPPPPAPVPVGAPYVPPVPGAEELQQPLGTVTEIWRDFQSPDMMNTLFPAPAAPPTPVREMPMGPPPPLDPAFIPPP